MSLRVGSLVLVPDEVPADVPDHSDDESGALTPEQLERLGESMEKLRRTMTPKVDFSALAGIAKIQADIAKSVNFKFPEGLLKSLTVFSSAASEAYAPFLASRRTWAKQFTAINSDYFETHAASQTQFAKLSAQLTRNVDFSLSESLSRFTEQFAAQQSQWLKSIGPMVARLKFNFYPPNLLAIEDLKFQDVEKVVMADGIALYGVPRHSIAEALILAESAAKRRELLGRRWKAISADCREALTNCESEDVAPYVVFGIAALDTLDIGNEWAAQALVGSLIDTLVTAYFGADRYAYTPNGKTTTNVAYEEFTVREFIAMAPIWQAYQQYHVGKGDPIPQTFSRHATAHTVSPRQYSRRNAVQGLMLACSLIYFFNEQAGRPLR